MSRKDPLDDAFDPKHFMKKIETDVVFNSDGEPEYKPSADSKQDNSSNLMRQLEKEPGQVELSVPRFKDGSTINDDQILTRESKINYQYQDTSIKTSNPYTNTEKGKNFTGIYEDEYFMFVEDYDKFIGEFVSDDKIKIIRGFLNNNEYNRIYYTRMVPNEMTCANLIIVHGFGHTVKYLDVGFN